jgi:hypothetical protein
VWLLAPAAVKTPQACCIRLNVAPQSAHHGALALDGEAHGAELFDMRIALRLVAQGAACVGVGLLQFNPSFIAHVHPLDPSHLELIAGGGVDNSIVLHGGGINVVDHGVATRLGHVPLRTT